MFKSRHRIEILAGILFLSVSAEACGPWLPNRLLSSGGSIILDAPEFYFEFELKRIAAEFAVPFKAVRPERESDARLQTYAKDLADFQDALKTGEITESDPQKAAALHEKFRQALNAPGPAAAPAEQRVGNDEFTFYHQGAFKLKKGDPAKAAKIWQALLELPEKQRQYRSTWAAYMLGQIALAADKSDDAHRFFQQTRDLAAAGFHDSLGLASASYGWDAQIELKANALEAAAPLYLRQLASGDLTAVDSCKALAGDAYPPEQWPRFAADPLLRRITNAHFLGQTTTAYRDDPSNDGLKTWLAALDKLPAPVVKEADRLGWLAYSSGDFAQAADWLKKADPESGLSLWLRAKLDFRAGKMDAAFVAMAAAVRKIPAGESLESYELNPDQYLPSVVAAGDLGLLQLARSDFITALRTFLAGDHWQDAAYIAERVLTLDELQKLVDADFPASPSPPKNDQSARDVLASYRIAASEIPLSLRWLLARRLARSDRFDQARPYFPEDIRPSLDAYAKSLAAGRDEKSGRATRAAALWEAAKIAREKGMELLGSELEPDAFIWEGQYEEDAVAAQRRTGQWTKTDYPAGEEKVTTEPLVIPVSKSERARLTKSAILPEKRFHYRYIAADLAWRAASLMPGDSEETAQILHTAGSWLKQRDEAAADRFIQAIERRCPGTPTGKAVLQKHWFIADPAETPGA